MYLYFHNLNNTLFINTDAFNRGIGAILYQKEGIIAYFSNSLSDAQPKYTTTKKECLAIKLAIEKWKTWLGGSKIIVSTDNKNLISHTNNFDRKAERWKTELGQYQIEYKFVEGKDNGVADELRRKLNTLEMRSDNNSENTKIRKIPYFHIVNDHPGHSPAINTLKENCELRRGDSAIIKKYIRECMFCQLNKPVPSIKTGLLSGHIATEIPFKSIPLMCMDRLMQPYSHQISRMIKYTVLP